MINQQEETTNVSNTMTNTATYTPGVEYQQLIRRRRDVAQRLGVTPTMRGQIVKSRTPYRDEFADRAPDPMMSRLATKGIPN
jgi:hypothetical protein